MLLVSTYIMYSEIDGFGLFATKNIAKDTAIWKYNSLIDIKLFTKDIEIFPDHLQDFIHKYGVHEAEEYYSIALDNARFMNHSDKPNCIYKEKVAIAAWDIKEGTELTENYGRY